MAYAVVLSELAENEAIKYVEMLGPTWEVRVLRVASKNRDADVELRSKSRWLLKRLTGWTKRGLALRWGGGWNYLQKENGSIWALGQASELHVPENAARRGGSIRNVAGTQILSVEERSPLRRARR